MSFKKNIIANYVSQIYMSLAGIIVLPLYLKYMGAEAYGLVGFFAMLQAWFGILDIGITPSVARETARLRGGASTALVYRTLLRALQMIFFIVALIGAAGIIICSGYIAHHWLKVQSLSLREVQISIQFMAIGVALRWISSLYRAILYGSEEFIWLSIYNIIFTTLRYIGVLLVLAYLGTSITLFFSYQIIIAALEVFILIQKSNTNLPLLLDNQVVTYSPYNLIASFKPILNFSLSIAATSIIWILITQTDKLILSNLIPLTEYGYFSLAVLAASGVMMFSGPIGNALLPRLAKLRAEGDDDNLILLYHKTTQLVAIIIVPASLILSFFSEQILWIWTGNRIAATQAAPVLRLYALGNGALALSAFPYYLQYAYGNMKLHLIGNIFFVIILIPSIILSTFYYGMIGAGWVWLLANLGFFSIWTAIVHNHFVKNLHFSWLFKNIMPIICISLFTIVCLKPFILETHNKLQLTLQMGLLGMTAMLFNIFYTLFPKIVIQLKFHFRDQQFFIGKR